MPRIFKTEFLDTNGELIGTIAGEGNLVVDEMPCQRVVYCYEDNLKAMVVKRVFLVGEECDMVRVELSDGSLQDYLLEAEPEPEVEPEIRERCPQCRKYI